jgi:hypothetical protein
VRLGVEGDIFMKEKELKILLDRDVNIAAVKQTFSKQIDTLVDMVNYGSYLILRAFDSSKKRLEDAIVIGVLLKQVTSMVDGIEVLASQGIVNPAYLQVRSAFEASLYIDWILKSESTKKAEYYYISNLRNTKLWTLRYLKGTKENLDYLELMSDIRDKIKPSSQTKEQEEKAKKQVADIDRVLNQDGYREINTLFEKRRSKTTGLDVHWYQLLGIASIKKLAETVGRLSEYVVYYSKGSEFTHTTSYRQHIMFNKRKVTFEPIRHLENMHSVLQAGIGICLSSYFSIINHYRYGESRAFIMKYKTDWQDAFLNMPTITYKLDN